MFEPAVPITHRQHHKQIALEGYVLQLVWQPRTHTVKQPYLRFAYALQIGSQTRGIAIVAARNRHLVPDSASGKPGQRKAAHLDRMVD